jgi:predicted amidohydrolase/ribosomal protein S18 acetylase RimI-like enzyme
VGNLQLEDFESQISVRSLEIGDFEAFVALQQRCFPGMMTWLHEQIESQLSRFPEGQICIEIDGKIVASSSSVMVDFGDYDEWHNWREIADDGYIRNHDPDGDTLYGIEIMVDPDHRGRRLARRLYDARKDLCRERNLRRIIIGGRIPGYGDHADRISAREYVEAVMRKELFDPVLTAQLANGFVLEELIPNYFPSDHASRGYATFLEWTNLDYVRRGARRLRAVSSVRLSIVQYQMRGISSFDDFASQCEFFCDVASEYTSDFVLFPELITTQLLPLCKSTRPGEQARELAGFTPQYLELFKSLAIKYNTNVIGGSQFEMVDGELYNVAFLFHRDGGIDRQPKLHVTPNEHRWWGVAPGDRLSVFDTDRGHVAILVCYDIEFPELARYARSKGADILFVPFNTDERRGYLRVRVCAQARAIENQMYVAIAGCTGNLPFVDNADVHYAQSAVLTPSDFAFARDGVAAETQENTETIIIQDVDTEQLRRHRLAGTVRTWRDRRTDLYRVTFKNPDGTITDV